MDRLARSGTVIDAFLLNFAKDEICGVGVLDSLPTGNFVRRKVEFEPGYPKFNLPLLTHQRFRVSPE